MTRRTELAVVLEVVLIHKLVNVPPQLAAALAEQRVLELAGLFTVERAGGLGLAALVTLGVADQRPILARSRGQLLLFHCEVTQAGGSETETSPAVSQTGARA